MVNNFGQLHVDIYLDTKLYNTLHINSIAYGLDLSHSLIVSCICLSMCTFITSCPHTQSPFFMFLFYLLFSLLTFFVLLPHFLPVSVCFLIQSAVTELTSPDHLCDELPPLFYPHIVYWLIDIVHSPKV